jgi:hypothetical protein
MFQAVTQEFTSSCHPVLVSGCPPGVVLQAFMQFLRSKHLTLRSALQVPGLVESILDNHVMIWPRQKQIRELHGFFPVTAGSWLAVSTQEWQSGKVFSITQPETGRAKAVVVKRNLVVGRAMLRTIDTHCVLSLAAAFGGATGVRVAV